MLKWIQVLLFAIFVSVAFYLSFNLWEGQLIAAFSIFVTFSAILIVFTIFIENRDPSDTLNWILVFALFPVLGFFFYIMFGRNHYKKKRYKQKQEKDKEVYEQIEENKYMNERGLEQMGDHQKMLFRLAHELGEFPISFNTETQVLTNGAEKFPKLLEAIQSAEHHIHLQYYIVRNDDIGTKIKDLLIKKAKEGVEVRFLYDAVGSWKLSNSYIDDLLEAGVKIKDFAPISLPFFGNRINFRNHRKIVVIDGKVGFVGGLNIGDEYLGKDKYYGNWRDTHLLVRGEAVRNLQMIFLQDWKYETGEELSESVYLSPELVENGQLGGVQMVAGGPDNQWETIKKLYFAMITSAKKSIWIASPYFIPDEDILTAMKVASLSGVDVRLLVPKRPDKRIVFYASRSYFPELMDAGIKIYEYKEGFMHSKIVIVDSELASIGTSNMDMRSFHLNFEVNAFLFRTKSTAKLVEDYQNDVSISDEIDPDEFMNRSIFIRVMESLFRLLSPML
ncbi:cardiolipin synthase [Bacillaceae bacterium W0354]